MYLKSLFLTVLLLMLVGRAQAQNPWATDTSATYVYNTNPGSISIGHSDPDTTALLSVKGAVRAKDLRLQPTTWSDFVFDDDYRLMPLPQLEDFIAENRHLPGIPAEQQVKQEGVSLSETQALLLQKIEELTLYVLALDKEGKALQQRLRGLEQAEIGEE